ncbi:flagellar basal body-associated FliL family protein [Pararhodobacter sp.]|uniref:flagellar basal body-associated FliL family protein n=1 Tax=Pararhodobacter sp. TaxID=2127056 RepID=UPI002FDE0360
MTDAAAPLAPPRKKGIPPVILGLGLALALGGAGFYATFSGLVSTDSVMPASSATPGGTLPPGAFAYVPIDPITINLGLRGQSRHLRFSAQLETAPLEAAEVTRLMPRILDVLNIYLRALEVHELEEPAALIRLRAQMLRRIQIVTGPDRVNDLLITEFVFN